MKEERDDPPLYRLFLFRVCQLGSIALADVCFNRRAEMVGFILGIGGGADRVVRGVCSDKER